MNFLEQLWSQAFEGRNPQLVLAVITFVIHELAYFGRYLPFYLCDFIPSLRKYKIQTKETSSTDLAKCIKLLLFNHFFIQLPMMLGFHPLAEVFGMRIQSPFPPFADMISQITLFLIFEDFYHYWAHRLLHYGPFYKNIHKVHHEFAAPFGLAAEYAHWAETLILGMGTIGGPLLWVMATGNLHMATVITWVVLRLIQAVDAHSGYDFPWSLRNLFPLWGGADFHDYHHMAFIGNYSSSFRVWDVIFGTDKGFVKWKASKNKAKSA